MRNPFPQLTADMILDGCMFLMFLGLPIAFIVACLINVYGGPDRCDVYQDITLSGRVVMVERCVGVLGIQTFNDRILSDEEADAWKRTH